MNKLKKYKQLIGGVLVFVGAFFVFACQMQGFKILDPTYTDWLYVLNSDYSSHYMGWEYFRNQPWGWPIGKLEQYAYPMVSSIGYTDSIPLLAIFFKAIGAWLPASFQYFGWWLLVCYVLQGLFAFKIGCRLFDHLGWQLVLSGFVMIAAPLLYRTPHPALCGQWLLLVLFYLYLNNSTTTSVKGVLVIILLAAWIHPYLLVMCLGIGLTILGQNYLNRGRSLKWSILNAIMALVLAVASLYTIGYFIIDSGQAVGLGLGEFSANLNTFVNPMGFSQFFSDLPMAFSGQYEGFAYLGAGLWALVFPGLILFLISQKKRTGRFKKHLFFLLGIGVFAVLAISPAISWNQHILVQFKLGQGIFNTFRSSGRFIWPLYYLIVIGVVWMIYKFTPKKIGLILAISALIFQSLDMQHLIHRLILRMQTYESPLNPIWKDIFEHTETVYLFPPYVLSYGSSGDVLYFLDLGRKTNTNVSSGHLARRDDNIADSLYNSMIIQFEQGAGFDQRAIYVAGLESLPLFKKLLDNPEATIRQLDDYILYVPNSHITKKSEWNELLQNEAIQTFDNSQIWRIDEWMQQDTSATYILSVRDEGSRKLCAETRQYFRELDSGIDTLQYRMAYVGIFHQNQLLQERIQMNPIDLRLKLPTTPPLPVTVQSAGAPQSLSSIQINGQEYSPNLRGINIVKVDGQGEVVEALQFDTYERCARLFLITQ